MRKELKDSAAYPYDGVDRIKEPNTYFYTVYGGPAFLSAYSAARAACRAEDSSRRDSRLILKPSVGTAASLFARLLEEVNAAGRYSHREEPGKSLAALVKRFEVTKRLYTDYGPDMKPLPGASFEDYGLYLAFAELLESAWSRWHRLSDLNALLKVMDTLSSVRKTLSPPERARLSRLARLEEEHVKILAATAGLPPW